MRGEIRGEVACWVSVRAGLALGVKARARARVRGLGSG